MEKREENTDLLYDKILLPNSNNSMEVLMTMSDPQLANHEQNIQVTNKLYNQTNQKHQPPRKYVPLKVYPHL